MIRTLSARLFFLTALWAIVATSAVAWYLAESFRTGVEINLRERLTANLYNVMGSVSQTGAGQLTGGPDLRDSRFLRPGSGYYWKVSNLTGDDSLSSASLAGGVIEVPEGAPFDSGFQREFLARDVGGQELIGIEARAFLGDGDALYSFVITANRNEADEQVSQFVQRLLIVLSLFALGFILVTFFLVRLGLNPIKQATARLADIREGKAERISGEFPLEIQPLIDETNALIVSNRNVVERARTQVGNLAHSLKTPLAVLRNEASRAAPAVRQVVEQQVQLMQSQVQTYLDRARISARSGTVTSRTEIAQSLTRLVRVMQKLNPNIDFTVTITASDPVFAGEQQDFEEMAGNLLENAAKFASSRVEVSATTAEKAIVLSIGDDGDGMTQAQIREAVKRGTRLDESKPGSGLGLSIVRDIAKEYNGTLTLGRSKLGGLNAELKLPLAGVSR